MQRCGNAAPYILITIVSLQPRTALNPAREYPPHVGAGVKGLQLTFASIFRPIPQLLVLPCDSCLGCGIRRPSEFLVPQVVYFLPTRSSSMCSEGAAMLGSDSYPPLQGVTISAGAKIDRITPLPGVMRSIFAPALILSRIFPCM